MSKLDITLVQTDIYWENIPANLGELEEKLSQDKTGDIIVLPEMFNTGFSMEVEKLAEPMNFTTFKWMHQQAQLHQAVIIGSFIVKDKDGYYNRALWLNPNGEFGFYNKTKPFTMMGEDKKITPGKTKEVFEYKGWKIKLLICYDLRFPEVARNHFDKETREFEYDLLIYMGNWPSARIHAWSTLLQARAMENSCYVAAVNRIGKDGNGIPFNGHSALLNPKGEYLIEPTKNEFIQTFSLNLDDLNSYRDKFKVHLDW